MLVMVWALALRLDQVRHSKTPIVTPSILVIMVLSRQAWAQVISIIQPIRVGHLRVLPVWKAMEAPGVRQLPRKARRRPLFKAQAVFRKN